MFHDKSRLSFDYWDIRGFFKYRPAGIVYGGVLPHEPVPEAHQISHRLERSLARFLAKYVSNKNGVLTTGENWGTLSYEQESATSSLEGSGRLMRTCDR